MERFAKQTCETEETILEERKYGLAGDLSIKTPTTLKGNPTLRLFCSNLGLTSLANWGNFTPLEVKFDENNEVTSFKNIDKEQSYVY